MASEIDDDFYLRADAHINLSNDQGKDVSWGKVSASMMYATARFNVWLTAKGHETGKSLDEAKEEAIVHFLNSYREMLDVHFKEYVANFEDYMKPR